MCFSGYFLHVSFKMRFNVNQSHLDRTGLCMMVSQVAKNVYLLQIRIVCPHTVALMECLRPARYLVVLVPLQTLDVARRTPARRRYCMHGCKVQSAPTTTVSCINSLHAYSYIQQSGHSVKTMNAKNTKKSQVHENADANITCYFGDDDISRFRSRLPHTHIVSSNYTIYS